MWAHLRPQRWWQHHPAKKKERKKDPCLVSLHLYSGWPHCISPQRRNHSPGGKITWLYIHYSLELSDITYLQHTKWTSSQLNRWHLIWLTKMSVSWKLWILTFHKENLVLTKLLSSVIMMMINLNDYIMLMMTISYYFNYLYSLLSWPNNNTIYSYSAEQWLPPFGTDLATTVTTTISVSVFIGLVSWTYSR